MRSLYAEEWSMMVNDRSCVIEDFGICQGQDSRGLVWLSWLQANCGH